MIIIKKNSPKKKRKDAQFWRQGIITNRGRCFIKEHPIITLIY